MTRWVAFPERAVAIRKCYSSPASAPYITARLQQDLEKHQLKYDNWDVSRVHPILNAGEGVEMLNTLITRLLASQECVRCALFHFQALTYVHLGGPCVLMRVPSRKSGDVVEIVF